MKRLHGPRGAATLSPAEAKAALRTEMRRLRRRLASAAPDARDRLAGHWTAGAPSAVPNRVVAAYEPVGSELDPRPLVARLAGEGWRAALPWGTSRDAPLGFRAAGEATPLAPDVILVPVLAFDRFGGRLGQGSGWYDRTLAALRDAAPVFVVGLAFAGQEVPRLPGEAHDQRLDAILTEKGWLEVLRKAP